MTTILLREHQECVIVGDYDKHGYYFLNNMKTGWVGMLYVNPEHKTYNIVVLFDKDTFSLGYFREAMKEHGWGEEE